MKHEDVIIIGCGMTGLSAGITFKKLGLNPLLIDKGRGYGGRLATRRILDNSFDHGAQYIEPSPRFLSWLEEYLNKDQLVHWNFSSSIKTFISKQGMANLAKNLSNELNVKLNTRVEKIKYESNQWHVQTDGGQSFFSKRLLLTAPLPQSLDLLQKNNIFIEETDLTSITYRPCLVLMMVLSEIHNLPEAGGMFIKNPILEWVCDNQKKGISNNQHSITVHCTNDYSTDSYDLSDEKIFESIYSEFSKYFPNTLLKYEIKKWKYSSPTKIFKSVYYRSNFPGLYLAGDAFGGGSLEGAFRSGEATAHIMTDDVLI